jgi:hypothetical protein
VCVKLGKNGNTACIGRDRQSGPCKVSDCGVSGNSASGFCAVAQVTVRVSGDSPVSTIPQLYLLVEGREGEDWEPSILLKPWWKVFTARYGLIVYIKQVFITVVESVYSAVRTGCLYKAGFYNCGGKCLQLDMD